MPADDRPLHPATVAVTAGRGPAEPGAPLTPPVVLATTFRPGGPALYGREHNPTWSALEDALGALEGGTATAFASGMGAITAVLDTLPPGARVVAASDLYTLTGAHLDALAAAGRVVVTRVDVTDTGAVVGACHGADLLWLESPTNPLLQVCDLPAVIAGAAAAGARVVVDNTFATPLLQRPLELGADIVVHSATKYIAGHSDVLLGVAVARDPDLVAALRERRTRLGAVPGPLEAFLALRGLRTLPVRLERASATAAELAQRLAAHPRVEVVRYPGLPGDPGHARAAAQMDGFGAMLSFDVVGGARAADAVCEAVRVAVHTTSLGGVETTLERRAANPGQEHLPPGLVRLSVGCEHVEDLWRDLDGALRRSAEVAASA